MGDSEISYDRNGEIKWICLHEPALLSYKVSSLWNNGVYVLSLSDCEHLKKVITDTCNELRKAGNDELAKELHVALSIIEDAGPYTDAST
ncbi:MAG: hypothetical protein IJL26_00395 [Clostridia bacterium]|nr:hypothetical protein [Clostridia bacterium]